MSKTCNNCRYVMDDDANICPRCGTQYIAQSQPQQSYKMPEQRQYSAPIEAPMTVGSWAVTILLTNMLGIISIVLLFVWAFGSDVPITKKNYCRAMLIIDLVLAVLAIIFTVVFIAIFVSSGALEELIEALEQYGSIA